MASLFKLFLLITGSFACFYNSVNVYAANVFVSALYGEGSHFLAASAIGRSLVARGHNVTFLISSAYFEHRIKNPKFSVFSYEIFKHPVPDDEVREMFHTMNTLAFIPKDKQFTEMMKLLTGRMVDDCEYIISDKDFVSRLKVMDVMVLDISWPCVLMIREALRKGDNSSRYISMVTISHTPSWSGFLRSSGSSFTYSYQPEFTSGLPTRMNFIQRIQNVLMSVVINFLAELAFSPPYSKIGKRLGLPPIHFAQSYSDFDLHLTNLNFASDFISPLAPNVIPVGGLTANLASPLQKELEEFVQSSGDHGVIVFTLGTYLASITTIRPEIVTMFAEAFRRLPQKVIWQLKELPDWELPSNVKAMPWLPQNDLLGHPKTRVFMYQGGNNGFQEACYHGVPIVVIPLQGDQYDVAARIEARGLGKKIEKLELNADIIYDTLTEVINNPSYNEVADKVSAIYKDQPMSAPDRAAFWIEHVIKFGGAYMRSPANDLTFIQYHLIDVYAFLTAIVVVFLAVVYYTLKFCVSLCCRMIGRGSSGKSKTE
ncbi:UDP-glucuronosyltransferase 1A1-like isoform X3 [Lytechinus variegatus]|uniref:UDP-glucuronosyltransferase 1A1-like isoform X3 n=1 Tax=Lytechinus variegatus TaxID=7654 RepID=UPI001BB19422|nr:UDP-glucuronosyltransferase 1A1-like isoform X3 [Lytechinus variegatus]